MKILILLFYFIFLNLYSKSFEVEIFFSINLNDIDIIGLNLNTFFLVIIASIVLISLSFIVNFGNRISNARKAKGWNHAELGKRIAETVNVIKSAESGKPPTDAVVRKLEMILGITLMVESSNEHESMVGRPSNSRGMTIGDYLKDLR